MDLDDVKSLLKYEKFEDVKAKLKELGVPVLEHYVDDRKTYNYERKFDLLFKDIFGISKRNKIHNINDFILGIKTKKEKNVHFSIKRLHINDYELSPSIIIKYVKNNKFEEMMEPLSLLFSNKPACASFKFSHNDSYTLNITQFKFNEEGIYEILEPCAALQNPVYGLLHYGLINMDYFYFNSFKVDNCYTSVLDNNYTSSYLNFFRSLEILDYEYELINDEIDKNMFYLKFYKSQNGLSEDKNRKPLLSLYLKNCFFYDFRIKNEILEKLLNIINESEQYIKVRHYSDEVLTLTIGEREFKIENSFVLLQDILKDLALEQKHLLKRIYYFFRELFVNYTKDGVITTNNYYDGYYSNNRSMISSKFRSNLLS